MSNIQKITFTGIDQYTNKDELIKLKTEYKNIEFGMLTSTKWQESGNRYPNPQVINALYDKRLTYSLHLCGKLADKALTSNYTDLNSLMGQELPYFSRLQLNVAMKKRKNKHLCITPCQSITEIIIQINESKELYNQLKSKNPAVVPLIDQSGGNGISSPISDELLDIDTPLLGYAGGINPNNCLEIVESLLEKDCQNHNIWIDMESGVRDNNDKFSVDACFQVCKKLSQWL